MRSAYTAVLAVSIALFGIVIALLLKASRRLVLPTSERLMRVACGTIVLAMLTLIGLLGGRTWLFESFQLMEAWRLGMSVVIVTIAAGCLPPTKRMVRDVRSMERMVAALTKVSERALACPISEVILTAREIQVLQAIGDGVITDAELATALFISAGTVRTHIRNLLKKTGLSNRWQLMLLASAWGPDEPKPGRIRSFVRSVLPS